MRTTSTFSFFSFAFGKIVRFYTRDARSFFFKSTLRHRFPEEIIARVVFCLEHIFFLSLSYDLFREQRWPGIAFFAIFFPNIDTDANIYAKRDNISERDTSSFRKI